MTDKRLGDFLRARRASTDPASVEVVGLGPRRVPGLRRDELARLVGMSVDYLTRLEQGRDRHPSPQVLRALAGPLAIGPEELSWVIRLSQPDMFPDELPDDGVGPAAGTVDAGVAHLLAHLRDTPGFVRDEYGDVLAANSLATALNPAYTVGTNLLRFCFLDPLAKRLYLDRDEVAADLVAAFRLAVGAAVRDTRRDRLVQELSSGSELFRDLWADHALRPRTRGIKRIDHPEHGRICLQFENLQVSDSAGRLSLVVFYAQPGSADEVALSRLADAHGSARRV